MKLILLLLFPFAALSQTQMKNNCIKETSPCNADLMKLFPEYHFNKAVHNFSSADTVYIYSDAANNEVQLHYYVDKEKLYTLFKVVAPFPVVVSIYSSYLGRQVEESKILASEFDKWQPYFKERKYNVDLSKLTRPDYWMIRIL